MSAIFLLLIPAIALASYRVLAARGASREAAVVGAAILGLALTVVPAYALRTKPSRGHPLETPVGPAFAQTGPRTELLTEFRTGWSSPIERNGETVRDVSGRAELVVGPPQSTRPRSTLSFEAAAARPTRLALRLDGRSLADLTVASKPSVVSAEIPPGSGPAVLELKIGPGSITVPVATVHAFAESSR